jgi:hypothetical protein
LIAPERGPDTTVHVDVRDLLHGLVLHTVGLDVVEVRADVVGLDDGDDGHEAQPGAACRP